MLRYEPRLWKGGKKANRTMITTDQNPPSLAPLVPARLVPFVRTAHVLLSRSLCRGCYAKNHSGVHTGLHSSDATSWDLAGALWVACGSANEAQRDADFRTLWDFAKAYAEKRSMPDAKFALWLDERDKEWHLTMLAVLVGDQAPTPTPTARPARDERIVQKYA